MMTLSFIILTSAITLAGIPAWTRVISRIKHKQPVITPLSETRRDIDGFWALAALVAWLGSQILGLSIFFLAIGMGAEDAGKLTTTQTGIMMLATGMAQLFALATASGAAMLVTRDARSLGWRFDRWHVDWKLAIGCFLLATPIIMLAQTVLSLLVPYTHPIMEAIIESRNWFTVAAVAFAAVIAAPIGEEILFRGFIQNWLQKRLTGWQPIVITSALFALAHWGQGLGPISLFGFSLLLGYLFRQTGSLLPCIALHMMNNAYGVFWLVLQVVFGETAAVP